MKRALGVLGAWLLAASAVAGTRCDQQAIGGRELAAAAATAVQVAQRLDAIDAPVLLARNGTDLSAHGLVYSHAGFVVRDHPAGRWSVVHLLNRCGSDHSGLYVQGLVNFFADDLVEQRARVVQLEPALARAVLQVLHGGAARSLHQPRYNLIARPDSRRYQNSTSWLLEVLASASLGGTGERGRTHARLRAEAFVPDSIRIAYSERLLGGLFAANTVFTDHPVATRLSGRYPVVTVRAILHHLDRRQRIVQQWELRDGDWHSPPGPA